MIKYFINHYGKLNYKKGSKLISEDEYLFNYYKKEEKERFNC